MTVLIRQAADILRRQALKDDFYTHAVIVTKEADSDYNFFIHAFEEQVRFYNNMIYRLKQERDENKQNLDS